MAISEINGIAVSTISHFNGVAKSSVSAINGVTAGFGGGGAFGGPEIVGVGAIAGASASVTPVIPAHQADDILILHAMNSGNANQSAPGGWNLIDTVNNGIGTKWWWLRAASSSETNPLVSGGSAGRFARVYVVRGCIASGTPYEDATTANATGDSTPDTASIDTTGADRLVTCFEVHHNSFTYSSFPPSGWNPEDSTTTTDATDAGFSCMTQEKASAGNVPTAVVATLSSTTFWATLTLAFIPD